MSDFFLRRHLPSPLCNVDFSHAKQQEPFQNMSTFCEVRKRENISIALINFVPLRTFLAKYRETRTLECRRESGMTLVARGFTTHCTSDPLEHSATIDKNPSQQRLVVSRRFPCFGLVSWKYPKKLIMVCTLLDNSLGRRGAYRI